MARKRSKKVEPVKVCVQWGANGKCKRWEFENGLRKKKTTKKTISRGSKRRKK